MYHSTPCKWGVALTKKICLRGTNAAIHCTKILEKKEWQMWSLVCSSWQSQCRLIFPNLPNWNQKSNFPLSEFVFFQSSTYNDCIPTGSQKYQLGTIRIPKTMDFTIRALFKGSYNWSLGCWSLSPSGLLGWPGEGLWGGCVAEGRVCVMGMAPGTIPSTGGGRPPEAKLTTPGGYL